MYAGTMADIRITVDGEPALTVELAAERFGIKPKSMSGELTRHKTLQPVAALDGRKKLYRVADIEAMMAGRPGKGANLRRALP